MLPFNKSSNATVERGNLYLAAASYDSTAIGSVGVSSGKWYYEARVPHNYGSYYVFGWVLASDDDSYLTEISTGQTNSLNWSQLKTVVINGSNITGTTTPNLYNTSTKIVGCALDLDNNKVYWHGNNTYIEDSSGNVGNPSAGTYGYDIPSSMQGKTFYPMVGTNKTSASPNTVVNFGQDSSFQGNETAQNNTDANSIGDFYYTPPTGTNNFLALSSANAPTSDDIDPAQTNDDFSSKQFNAITWTGNRVNNSTVNNISGVGFTPDLVWLKFTEQAYDWRLVDSSRGVTKSMRSNQTTAEATESNGIYQFDSDGFSVKGDNNYNYNGGAFIGYCWRANGGTTATNNDGSTTSTVQANTKAGFSIITYTGNGSNRTIGHGLSSAPDLMIFKDRDAGSNWVVYARSQGAGNRGQLNTSNAWGSSSTSFQSTDPDNSVITLGTSSGTNASGNDFVCYAWHNVDGMQRFSTYTGNGSSDGPTISLGFRPKMICIRRTTAGQFNVFDSARSTFNPVNKYLGWNVTDTEQTGADVDFLSNGFKVRSSASGVNTNGTTYIFMAWADQSAKYSNAF